MKQIHILAITAGLLLTGCNSLRSAINPDYKDTITPIFKLGVTGGGATPASQAFMELGYQVIDLGNDSSKALEASKAQFIPFLATAEPVGTEGSWWDGVFDFTMRVAETGEGVVVWSAIGEYKSSVLGINQDGSTRKAFRDMVKDFSQYFPPAGTVPSGNN